MLDKCVAVQNITHASIHTDAVFFIETLLFLEIHFTMMGVLSMDSIIKPDTFVCVRNAIKADEKDSRYCM